MSISAFRRFRPFLIWIVLIAAFAGLVWFAVHRGTQVSESAMPTMGPGGPGPASPPSPPAASSPASAPTPAAGGAPGGMRPGVQPVQAATATQADLPVYVTGLGTVTAGNTVTVRSRVDGELVRLHFTEGQTVKAGQLLAEIDPRSFQVALAQAQGQLATDQANLANARADLERYRVLLAQDSVTRQKYDTQIATVRQLEGTVVVGKAAVDSAKLQLDYSRITAPIGGVAGLKQVDVGNQIKSGDTTGLVVITQVDPINVIFPVPESQLQMVLPSYRSGQSLTVQAWDREMKKLLSTGRLASIDNQIDTTTGTVKMKAEFANADARLFPNQFVNIRLLADTVKAAVVVPSAAVQLGKQGNFVWLVGADNKVKSHLITIGQRDNDKVQILDGVQLGDRLVTDGVDRLREDTEVQIIDPAAATGGPPSGQAAKPRQSGRQ